MSQTLSIANRPRISPDVTWRVDGEDDQIVVLSREGLPLPLILNPTAARIFSLCDGEHTVERIVERLQEEFAGCDFYEALEDVKKQLEYFLEKGIVEIP